MAASATLLSKNALKRGLFEARQHNMHHVFSVYLTCAVDFFLKIWCDSIEKCLFLESFWRQIPPQAVKICMTIFTLENRYGFWPQTGCVTVPGRDAAFLVARQRFPYRSRFNFSVKNMENMLLWNAICDIMHIDFNRNLYCGANDASIGF